MKRSLIALAAAGLLGFGLTFSAAAMPMGKLAPASDNGVIQVRGGHGHGHGHGHMGRGGRGHHHGWGRGHHHHRGWR